MSGAASRRAQSRLKTPSREIVARADDARATEVTKTARLRGLRLAKEAADREAAQQAPPLALGSSAPQRRPLHGIRKLPSRGSP